MSTTRTLAVTARSANKRAEGVRRRRAVQTETHAGTHRTHGARPARNAARATSLDPMTV
jgi:hypothetical protein